MLCHNEPLRTLIPTVGCNVDVRLHTYTTPTTSVASTARSGIPSLITRSSPPPDPLSGAEPTFIEFYDISGSPAVRHPKSRGMFYSGTSYQGLILVHDLCNRRSYENLWKWMSDFMEGSQSASVLATGGYNSRQYGQLDIPLLVVGTKNDMAASQTQPRSGSMALGPDLVEKYSGEAISVCTISPSDFMPNSSASIAFNMFFNSVIDPITIGPSFSRSRTHSNQSGYLLGTTAPSPAPMYSRPSRTPTPGQERSQHQNRALSNDSDSASPAIPIVDFATFTGGSPNTVDRPDDYNRTPSRGGSPLGSIQGQNLVPEKPVTPTGISSATTLSTKSALRAQYERNRSVLNQYSIR
ncbi:Rab-like protein 3 [Modicella reniformis]|uniref:Rab-like protein 3 n=1 Tax=Modicella reniformis TaxID=1440133 RepID=A0A9P6MBR8_9FUNG|nr:Rab-like protein 3 [Modicella reniformis]